MAAKINLVGEKFGHLVVLSQEASVKRNTYWKCQCDCGTTIVCKTKSLRLEGKTSCGCDTFDRRSVKLRTHGLSKTPVYKSWRMMKSRCLNPNYTHYEYYGGRGVSIYPEWVSSFEKFLEDMGPRPDGYTLDRKDTNGDYTPENCRWSTREEQVDNRRNTVFLEYAGVTLSVKEWAKVLHVKRSQIYLALYNGATLAGYIEKRKLGHRVTEYQTGGALTWDE